MQGVEQTAEIQLVERPDEERVLVAFSSKRIPASVPAAERERLRSEALSG